MNARASLSDHALTGRPCRCELLNTAFCDGLGDPGMLEQTLDQLALSLGTNVVLQYQGELNEATRP